MSRSLTPMSEGLTRQRRNLFVLSAMIWFLNYGGVKIERLGVLGFEFQYITNLSAIYLSLWLAWGYFVLRYYQYFMQEGVPKLFGDFLEILDELSTPRIKELVLVEHPKDIREDCNFQTLRYWGWKYHGQAMTGKNELGEETLENFEMDVPAKLLWREILSSVLIVTLNRSAVTDYVLPILLALYVLTTSFAGWPGGVCELIWEQCA